MAKVALITGITRQSELTFAQLVKLMVLEDIKLAERDVLCTTHGFDSLSGDGFS